MQDKEITNEVRRKRFKNKKDNGICKMCHDPICEFSSSVCEYHYNLEIQRKQTCRDNNVCTIIGCKNTPLKHIDVCEDCKMEDLSLTHLGTRTRSKELKQKFDNQNQICVHTDFPIPSSEGNFSIDHVKSQCEYPDLKNDINNMVFCEISFNRAKSNIPEKDFKDYFYRVAKSFINKYEKETGENR